MKKIQIAEIEECVGLRCPICQGWIILDEYEWEKKKARDNDKQIFVPRKKEEKKCKSKKRY